MVYHKCYVVFYHSFENLGQDSTHIHKTTLQVVTYLCLYISKEAELIASSGSPTELQPSDCENLLPDTHLLPVFLYLLPFGQSFPLGPHKLSLTLLSHDANYCNIWCQDPFSFWVFQQVCTWQGFKSPLLLSLLSDLPCLSGKGVVAWENAQTVQGVSCETWTNDNNHSY